MRHWSRFSLAAGVAMLALTAKQADAAPNYSLLTTIAITPSASNASGNFTGYDLSVIDPSTQLYYLTDRSNNGIDVLSAKTNTYVTRIGQGMFAGSAGGNNDIAGPNGVAIVNVGGGKLLLAGNTGAGNAGNVIAFDLASNGLSVNGTRTITTAVPGTTPTPSNRVDGVAYAPTTNTILAADNASNPGYITLTRNDATGTIIKTLLLNGAGGLPNAAGNGVEAPIFNTATGTFFVAIPNLTSDSAGAGTGFGGIIEIDPATGNIKRTFDFQQLGLGGACNPTGLAQGPGGTMGAACGTTGYTVFLDPSANGGKGLLTASTAVSGGDQVAYDTSRNLYFEAARFDPSGPALGIFNGDGTFAQRLGITNNDHSVAVDPLSGEVFVAYGASSDTANIPGCAKGCVAVFAPVPEPSSLVVLLAGLGGLVSAAFVFRRRRR